MVEAELKNPDMLAMIKEQPLTCDETRDQLSLRMPVEQPSVTIEPLQPTSLRRRCPGHARIPNVRLVTMYVNLLLDIRNAQQLVNWIHYLERKVLCNNS